MGIKEELDKMYNVTDAEIDQIILDQEIEDEEKRLETLKEMKKFNSFENYVKSHEKDFDMVDISDDFSMIIISGDVYPNIPLDNIKKIGTIANHYGILVQIQPLIDNIDEIHVHKENNGQGTTMVYRDQENIIMTCEECSKNMYPNKGKLDAKVEDYVKLKFRGKKGNEYMWVKVTNIDKPNDGITDDVYNFEGVLDNDPVLVDDMKCGDIVRFRKEDILEIFTE